MESTSNHPVEGYTPKATEYSACSLSVSERGFTYLEMVIALALVTSLFPLVFSCFYTVTNDVRKQLIEHQLYDQYDQFQTQLMRDMANGTKIVGQDNQLIMTMGNGEQVRYSYIQNHIVRSVRQLSTKAFQGNTILLYHVKKITFHKREQGLQLLVNLTDQNAHFSGTCFVWGRVDE